MPKPKPSPPQTREYRFQVDIRKTMVVTIEAPDTADGRREATQEAIDACCDHGELCDAVVAELDGPDGDVAGSLQGLE